MRAVRFELCVLLSLLACESTPEAPAPVPPLAVSVMPDAARPVTPETVAPNPVSVAKTAPEEPGTRLFWVDPVSHANAAALRLQTSQPKEAAWLRKLAAEPTAVWFTQATTQPFIEAERLAKAVAGTNHYVVAVIAALPKRDCARYSSPGLAPAAYRTWIQDIARGLGETPVYWIMEPEALLLTACLKAEEVTERMNLIAESILHLKKNPRAQVYIDVGYPGWLSVDEAVQRLMKAGVMTADGFALNVGNYQWTEDCIRYGQDISQKIGGKTFVIDSSRNGKGPVRREAWCNPKNRAIGETPQAPTGIKGLDAYLWLKQPGISDGSCNGGPAAGQWWEAKAIELMRNATYPD